MLATDQLSHQLTPHLARTEHTQHSEHAHNPLITEYIHSQSSYIPVQILIQSTQNTKSEHTQKNEILCKLVYITTH